jgi:pyrroline-5-carboxylate reductase
MPPGSAIIAFDNDEAKLADAVALNGVSAADNFENLLKESDALVLAVKPQIYEIILGQAKNLLGEGRVASDELPIVITIAAGVSISYIQTFTGAAAKIVRVMPNTPAMVGEGMAALTPSDSVSDDELAKVLEIFSYLGKTAVVDEAQMDAVVAVSGSSPAYTYMYIQALEEKAIELGIPPDTARMLAAQSTLGAAKMVLENPDVSTEQLRINVCSPGGTTIEAVNVLEDSGFIEIVKEAAQAANDKSKKMTLG